MCHCSGQNTNRFVEHEEFGGGHPFSINLLICIHFHLICMLGRHVTINSTHITLPSTEPDGLSTQTQRMSRLPPLQTHFLTVVYVVCKSRCFSCVWSNCAALMCCVSFRFVLSLRAYTPQGYKTPTADKTRPVRAATATPTSSQLSAIPLSSSAPKSMYGKNRQTTWLTEDGSFTSSSANTTSSSDGSSKKYVSRGTSK